MAPEGRKLSDTPSPTQPLKRGSAVKANRKRQLPQPSYWNILPCELRVQVINDLLHGFFYRPWYLMRYTRGRSDLDRTVRGLLNLEGGSWEVLQQPLEKLHRMIFEEHNERQCNRQPFTERYGFRLKRDRWEKQYRFRSTMTRLSYLENLERDVLNFLDRARPLSKYEKTLKQELQKMPVRSRKPTDSSMDAWEDLEKDLRSRV